MFVEHNTSILLIVNATYEDTGEYICRMENKEGVSISRASINVMKRKYDVYFLVHKVKSCKYLKLNSAGSLKNLRIK